MSDYYYELLEVHLRKLICICIHLALCITYKSSFLRKERQAPGLKPNLLDRSIQLDLKALCLCYWIYLKVILYDNLQFSFYGSRYKSLCVWVYKVNQFKTVSSNICETWTCDLKVVFRRQTINLDHTCALNY